MTFDKHRFPYDSAVHFTEKDDQLHHIRYPNKDWTETTWWSFNVPERGLAGWLYCQMRPNLGAVTGGAFVYGPQGWLSWEIPYYGWFNFLPMDPDMDLRDVTFRNGVSVKMREPGMVYDLGFRFRDQQEFVADLHFEGLTPPVPHVHGAPPFSDSSHYDQHGRVTGTLYLHGEEIPVDCFAVRDRSWGRRPEHTGPTAKRLSYVFGTVSPDEMFLIFTLPQHNTPDCEVEHLSSGYLVRDGVLRRLKAATRHNQRDPGTGAIASLEVKGEDEDGRTFAITGQPVSRMALHTTTSLCINSCLKRSIDGREAWGEDQDVWPLSLMREARARVPGKQGAI